MRPYSWRGRAAAAAPRFEVGAPRRPVNDHSPRIGLARPPQVVAVASARAAVLRVEAVSKRWPRQPQPVLQDVSFELAPGEFAWLTGANGVGKTTLLRIIAGVLAPDQGRVDVCGLEAGARRREYQRAI